MIAPTYDIPDKIKNNVFKAQYREVLLPRPNFVAHPLSFHITVTFSKNEITIILFFAVVTICGDILEKIYYTKNVKCYGYRQSLS
jgi:hypothetical protein